MGNTTFFNGGIGDNNRKRRGSVKGNTTFFNGGVGDESTDIGQSMGASAGNTSATRYIVEDVDRFVTPRGHGFAAEKMNDLYDKAHGHDAKVVGGDNAKNGADRIA